ncbi:MTA/SAH nucleosidase [Neobacillus bataviensis LMG 21833]|uniref:MTA/SAH nucleosidase n=2 Tax=Neobacillus bataviensis TaxID=220685 RepID=K6DRE8_9BACI|nr:MTA/SAH nucleosidase [Neobacillus bataviensis LMG 21833]
MNLGNFSLLLGKAHIQTFLELLCRKGVYSSAFVSFEPLHRDFVEIYGFGEGLFMNKHVIVYTTNDCIECSMVKQVLTQEGIAFEIRDVSTNADYQKEVEKFGFMGVPVTVVGERTVKGFTNELKELIDFVKIRD